MAYRKIIIIAIFYILDIVVLTIEIVSITGVILVAGIVLAKSTLIIFRDIVVVLIAGFMLAKVLFIVNILFVVFVNTIERD